MIITDFVETGNWMHQNVSMNDTPSNARTDNQNETVSCKFMQTALQAVARYDAPCLTIAWYNTLTSDALMYSPLFSSDSVQVAYAASWEVP